MKTGKNAYPARYVLGLSLLGVAFVWGSTFSLIKVTLQEMPVFWFLFLRFLIAFLFFVPLLLKVVKNLNQDTLRWGVILGFFLFLSYAFQTVGLKYTSSINAGFITGLFVVFTPLFSALIFRWFPHWASVVGVIVAFFGLSLLTLSSHFTFNRGDLLIIFSALSYSFHIVLVGRFTSGFNPGLLTWVQTFVVAALSLVATLLVEASHALPIEPISIVTLLITSIFATVVAFWVQIYVQRFFHPTRIALILLGEPVFAGVFGYFWLQEDFTGRKLIGAALILGAMIFSEIFSKGNENQRRK